MTVVVKLVTRPDGGGRTGGCWAALGSSKGVAR